MSQFKTALTATLFLSLVPVGFCSGVVKVQEIGLQGYYGAGVTRVRLELANPGDRRLDLNLRMKVWSRHKYERGIEDVFTKHVLLDAAQKISLELPILVLPSMEPVFTVEARDSSGGLLGDESVGLQSGRTGLIAIVCNLPANCQDAQNQIQYAGTQKEQEDRSRNTKIIALHELPQVWWAYMPASYVVLAMPTRSMESSQLAALEAYLRNGGRLVLLENESAPSEFLSRYRSADPMKPIAVGRGLLYREPGLASKDLGPLFDGLIATPAYYEEYSPWLGSSSRPAWPFTHFHFPRLRWLLLWMAIYTLILGVLNFAVLKRVKRLELGWVTVPAIAICFAVAMYVASNHRQPKLPGFDEGTVDWMDNGSSMAGEQLDVRVSSPFVGSLQISLPDGPVFTHGIRMPIPTIHINSEDRNSASDWNVDLGPPERMRLTMLRLSYQDLGFRAVRQMPGTVEKVSNTQFSNHTGRAFTQAVFMQGDSIYVLGSIPADGNFDIDKAEKRKREHTRDSEIRAGRNPAGDRINIEDFAIELVAPTAGGTFVGISESNQAQGSIEGQPSNHQQFTATVVNMSASQ